MPKFCLRLILAALAVHRIVSAQGETTSAIAAWWRTRAAPASRAAVSLVSEDND